MIGPRRRASYLGGFGGPAGWRATLCLGQAHCPAPWDAGGVSAFRRASAKWGCLAKRTFPALKSFVCYKSWRTVLEAPDGHETNFWQPQKFILVDLESVLLPLHSRIVLYEFNSTTCLNHLNKLSSSQKVLFHGSLPSTCPKTAHTP